MLVGSVHLILVQKLSVANCPINKYFIYITHYLLNIKVLLKKKENYFEPEKKQKQTNYSIKQIYFYKVIITS